MYKLPFEEDRIMYRKADGPVYLFCKIMLCISADWLTIIDWGLKEEKQGKVV